MSRYADTHQSITTLPFLSVMIGLMGGLMFLSLGIAMTGLESAASNVDILLEWPSNMRPMHTITFECTHDGAQELDTSRRFALADLPMLEDVKPDASTPFGRYLDTVKDSGPVYLLFVVRPDGLESFKRLRAQAVAHNRAASIRTVELSEMPNAVLFSELPAELKAKIAYGDGRLKLRGKLTEIERERLKSTLGSNEAREAINHIYELAQTEQSPLQYGVELLPANWRLTDAETDIRPSGG